MRIEIDQVEKAYGTTKALRGLSYSPARDLKVMALIGPSGGGKSTLLKLLGGLEVPDRGRVGIDGSWLSFDEETLISHRRANGFLFQAFNLFSHLTALENVMLPLVHVHGMDEKSARERAEHMLERFRLVSHAGHRPAELSGGQQQRIALARAVAAKPRLLLLDEPTSALDPEMTSEVLELIEELCEAGQQVVFSTHELGFAKAIAEEVLFLSEGNIVERGEAKQIFDSPASEAVIRFLDKVMRY